MPKIGCFGAFSHFFSFWGPFFENLKPKKGLFFDPFPNLANFCDGLSKCKCKQYWRDRDGVAGIGGISSPPKDKTNGMENILEFFGNTKTRWCKKVCFAKVNHSFFSLKMKMKMHHIDFAKITLKYFLIEKEDENTSLWHISLSFDSKDLSGEYFMGSACSNWAWYFGSWVDQSFMFVFQTWLFVIF